MEEKKRNSFAGSIGFVLAAAGSAVGLGNIWRFPYLAAKDGGGLFLVVYLVLALTFGYTLLTSEVSIGRKTKQSPLTAYKELNKKWSFLGVLACIVPFIILPYYAAIGGWVLKYFVAFITGHGVDAASDGYFFGYISGGTLVDGYAGGFFGEYESIVYMAIFMLATAIIIFMGVNGGIEKFSKILMPVLFVLVIGIAIFALTLKGTAPDGVERSGIDGLKVFLIPNLEGLSVKSFFITVMDAMGQLFYSLSVAMGIMVAYGSYVKDDANLVKSINQIEFFDTMVAVLAGVMIIPAVIVFMGPEGMSAGPSLMFVSLPKIFVAMGPVGNVIGTLFFAMVFFAALTSCISILEAIVSSFIDKFKMSRAAATIIESVVALAIGVIVCFGYNKNIFFFNVVLPNGAEAQVLDIMDYLSNNVMMPIVAIGTCILIGWILKPQFIIDEAEKGGYKMGRKRLYKVMVKLVAPVLLLFLLLVSLGILKL